MLSNNHVFTDAEISCAKRSKTFSAEDLAREVALCLEDLFVCRFVLQDAEITIDFADNSRYKINVEKLTK